MRHAENLESMKQGHYRALLEMVVQWKSGVVRLKELYDYESLIHKTVERFLITGK